MKKLTGAQIRRMWLEFFASKGHVIEPGASLIPHNDPTLLWINAGVAALKKYFDGSEKPASPRITNAQKSLRTNDIENVGMTARHHTFFEMLGNFSIGDYFRTEAITWGWELLTSPKWFDFAPEQLYITVYPDDQESIDLWTKLGCLPDHIVPRSDNFWEIGEGPCGPDTEIYFDRGIKYDPQNIGKKLIEDDIENDRYIEIWNIVFSQFNSKEGVKREDYPELPQKNIDTGAGLERIACVMQGTETNFETDLFMPIIRAAEQYATIKYSKETKMAYHVIADHIRTCTFALADGAMFSNEGRGYVLRRILRRGVRYGKKIGIQESFMYQLVPVVAKIMNDYYPYLENRLEIVQKLVRTEEEKFQKTLTQGEVILLDYIDSKPVMIGKEIAFKLYDTYGFPIELTTEIAQEKGLKVDVVGFKEEMEKQKERARNARSNESSWKRQSKDLIDFEDLSEFTYSPEVITSTIIALFKDGEKVERIEDYGEVVLDKTNFYAESGGEVSDTGFMLSDQGKIIVEDVQKAPHQQFLHTVDTQGIVLQVGDKLELHVDMQKRNAIMKNHSAVHLLQKALQDIVDVHIQQAGSYVDAEKFRFDFSHYEKLSSAQIDLIEAKVNEVISLGLSSNIKEMPIAEAKKMGAMALFSEKYGDVVRVVNFSNYSIEFCGGCHVTNTSDIGLFVIEFEEAISSGIRRIQGHSGLGAYKYLKSKESVLNKAAASLGASSVFDTNIRLDAVLKQMDEQKHAIEKLKDNIALSYADNLISNIDNSKGYSRIISKIKNVDKDILVKIIDIIKSKNESYFVYLANVSDSKVDLLACCSQDLVKQGINCGKIIKETATILGGGGGGRPDMAQAGGKDISKVDQVIDQIKNNY